MKNVTNLKVNIYPSQSKKKTNHLQRKKKKKKKIAHNKTEYVLS